MGIHFLSDYIHGNWVDPGLKDAWIYAHRERVFEYITSANVVLQFDDEPPPIFEFATAEKAEMVGLVRATVMKLLDGFSALIQFRFYVQFFGVNPHGSESLRIIYDMPKFFIRLFLGVLPNMFGVDGGIFMAFWMIDMLHRAVSMLIIIDANGLRY